MEEGIFCKIWSASRFFRKLSRSQLPGTAPLTLISVSLCPACCQEGLCHPLSCPGRWHCDTGAFQNSLETPRPRGFINICILQTAPHQVSHSCWCWGGIKAHPSLAQVLGSMVCAEPRAFWKLLHPHCGQGARLILHQGWC